MAQIISELIQYLYEKERTHVFVYTRPENLEIFADMGFYAVYAAEGILLLENREKGFDSYLKQLEEETPKEALPRLRPEEMPERKRPLFPRSVRWRSTAVLYVGPQIFAGGSPEAV